MGIYTLTLNPCRSISTFQTEQDRNIVQRNDIIILSKAKRTNGLR